MKSLERSKDADVDAIRSVAAGDEGAFESLVEKYKHAVLNTSYRYLGDYSEAEDMAQEVFVKVWRNAARFKGNSKFSTWLYRIVVNHCISHKRKHKVPLVPLDEVNGLAEQGRDSRVEDQIEDRETSARIRELIAELPSRQKMALVLSAYEHKSYEEIASVMGVTLSSVTSLVFRAKDNLRKKLLPLKLAGEF